MRNWVLGMIGAALLCSGSASAEYCTKKRVDKCGCHHQFGVRHCHPSRKTGHCEAPVKHEVAAPKPGEKPQPKNAPVSL